MTFGFTRKEGDLLYSEIAGSILNLAKERTNEGLIVLIDGKAAAGKSWLADNLVKRLTNVNQQVCILEADWFLYDRQTRSNRLKELFSKQSQNDPIPADFHINFWRWNELKNAIGQIRIHLRKGGTLSLNNTYDRNTHKCDGNIELKIAANSIVLIPGSYLSGQAIDHDLSIMLFVSQEIGRLRKMTREYRKNRNGQFPTTEDIGTTVTTWELLEEPTFFYHMLKNGKDVNIVLDTSEPILMSVIKYDMPSSSTIEMFRSKGVDSKTKGLGHTSAILNFVGNASNLGKEVLETYQACPEKTIEVREADLKALISFS